MLKYAFDVRAEGPLPLFDVEIFKMLDMVLKGGVIHENVESTQVIDGVSHRSLAGPSIGDIEFESERSPPD